MKLILPEVLKRHDNHQTKQTYNIETTQDINSVKFLYDVFLLPKRNTITTVIEIEKKTCQ